jgi:hypothetical protein
MVGMAQLAVDFYKYLIDEECIAVASVFPLQATALAHSSNAATLRPR